MVVILNKINPNNEKIKAKLKNEELIFIFDYKTHLELNNLKIKNYFGDKFLKNEDIILIEEKSRFLSKWFEEKIISEKITFDEVNLGRLLKNEFHHYLIQEIKKILQVKKIYEEFRSEEFLISKDLVNILEKYTNKIQIIESEENSVQKSEKKIGDYVIIPFFSKKILVSEKTFRKINENLNWIFYKILNRKKNNKKPNDVVFIEFDIRKNFNLIKNISKNYNITLFNFRRPYIWNKNSFMKIFKSDFTIVNTSQKTLSKNEKDMISEFINLFKTNNFFENFFKYEDINLWKIIKNDFISIHENRFHDTIKQIKIIKNFLVENNFKKIFVWNENGVTERIIIDLASKMNIEIILIQHGMYYETKEANEYNEFIGIIPTSSTVFLGWGNPTIDYMKKKSHNKKMFAVRNYYFDEIYKKYKKLSKDEYILLVTTTPVRNISSDLFLKNIEEYLFIIKQIIIIAEKLNKKLIIKVHPDKDNLDLENYMTIPSFVQLKKFEDISPLIASCELMISTDLSTTILEAQNLEKPVIAVKAKKNFLGIPLIFKNSYCKFLDINLVEDELLKILKDNSYKKEIITNGTNFLKTYVISSKNSLEHKV